VYRYLRRRTGDHERAEDLTQQVFADAVASLRATQSPSLAWLYTVAQRRFVDEVRRRAAGERVGSLWSRGHDDLEYGGELAARLDVTPEAAKMRFVRALRALRDQLELEE
jgi:DNA-directed RNA polymerase specialized sigma24 family protein